MGRTTATRAQRTIGVGLTVLALLTAACGGASGPSVAIDDLSAVASAVEDAKTVRFEMRMEMAFLGQRIVMVGEGVSDATTGEGEFTMRGEGAAAPLLGENLLRTVGTTLYVQGPMAQQYLPGTSIPEGHWVAIDASAATAFSQQGAVDIEQLLASLRAAGGDVEELPDEELRGETVKVRRATTTIRDVYEQSGLDEDAVREDMITMLPPTDAAGEEAARAGFDASLAAPVTSTAWIGDDGLPRRLRMVTDMTALMELVAPGASDEPSSTTITLDLLEYGVDLDVQAPPEDRVLRAA